MAASTITQSEALVGTAGLDVLKIAGVSVSGWYPSFKTSGAGKPSQPFTSLPELMVGLYLEYHPLVATFQRGDTSAAFNAAHNLTLPIATPHAIGYELDGTAHQYLPDYVGRLVDGGLLIVEGGRERAKSEIEGRAKAEAARRWAVMNGGAYWIGTEEGLSRQQHENWIFLHTRRLAFPAFDAITPEIVARLAPGERISVRALIAALGGRWTDDDVEGAAWKVAGDAAAAGRLLVDLKEQVLDLDTELALLPPGQPPILPDPLPSIIEWRPEARPVLVEDEGPLPGPAIDAQRIPEQHRPTFNRNLHAVLAIVGGAGLRSTARDYDIKHGNLHRLVKRATDPQYGQLALWPHRTYGRAGTLREEFRTAIRELYVGADRPGPTAIWEHPKLKDVADTLTRRDGRPVPIPDYWPIYHYLHKLNRDPQVDDARSGLPHPPRPPRSIRSYVLSIPAPGMVTQVDEHYLDALVVAKDGTVLTRRVHAAVLICVKTAAILGAVLSLEALNEEDYMRLIKQALEPKDALTRLYGCTHHWTCRAKPSIIFHDRGKIFTAKRSIEVVVDRLKIIDETAPSHAPQAKGTVEALFTWVIRKFSHRLPNTTKGNPNDRGALDVEKSAQQTGMTFDVLEELFYQAIVDDYMRDWDPLRGQRRYVLWDEAVARHGVSRWLGSPLDLVLLLKRRVNRKNPATGRYAIHDGKLSFLGRDYVSPGVLNKLRGQELDLFYDRRDLAVIYLFHEGLYVGEAYCLKFGGRRVSEWEAKAEAKAEAAGKKVASAETRETRRGHQGQARSGQKAHQEETRRLEKARQDDQRRGEMHPPDVQLALRAIQADTKAREDGAAHPVAPSPLAPPVPDDITRPTRMPTIRSGATGS